MDAIVAEVEEEINKLFSLICFEIDKIEVKAYDSETLLVEFKGEDAALLIGKEGYRYKALSYMIFNWINTKYDVQLRLEIAEFLKNQEESVSRYLTTIYDTIAKEGRAQTKILDGVLVQIALKELRERYPEKYVVIRSTKDGLKYIIVNDYHTN
jgi:spoIIIJ-associated protein